MRKNIYVTLVGIFDISHRVSRLMVGFHREHLFCRSEIFDSGMFLTYYVGGEFPSTSFYENDTITYRAFKSSFDQNVADAAPRFEFGRETKEQDLIKLLGDLGCTTSLSDLRAQKNELYQRYEGLMQYKTNIYTMENAPELGTSPTSDLAEI